MGVGAGAATVAAAETLGAAVTKRDRLLAEIEQPPSRADLVTQRTVEERGVDRDILRAAELNRLRDPAIKSWPLLGR